MTINKINANGTENKCLPNEVHFEFSGIKGISSVAFSPEGLKFKAKSKDLSMRPNPQSVNEISSHGQGNDLPLHDNVRKRKDSPRERGLNLPNKLEEAEKRSSNEVGTPPKDDQNLRKTHMKIE